MFWNLYINKEWMVSRSARCVYRAAACLSLSLFLLIIALSVAGEVLREILPIRILVLVGAAGAATTTVAMWYFLLSFDPSSSSKKIFWFCLLTIPFLGPPLYCLLVYSRSQVIEKPQPGRQGVFRI